MEEGDFFKKFLLEYSFSPGICPGVGLLDEMVTLFSVFQETSMLFSTVAIPFINAFPSTQEAIRHLSHPQLHVLSAKDHTGEETALRGVGPRG